MNNLNTPLVSVIICTRNRASLLPLAIKSALSQTHPNIELVIIDDASTDNTEEVVKGFNDYRINYIKNEQNLGITKNRNKALGYAKGDFIAPLDDDDWWHDPQKLAKQVAFMELEKNKNVAVVGTQARINSSEGKTLFNTHFALTNKAIKNRMMLFNEIVHSTSLMRKKMLGAINDAGDVYDCAVPIWEDYDLFMNLGTTYELANLPDITTSYLRHQGNISNENAQKGIDATKMILKRYKNKYPFYYIGICKPIIKQVLLNLKKSINSLLSKS